MERTAATNATDDTASRASAEPGKGSPLLAWLQRGLRRPWVAALALLAVYAALSLVFNDPRGTLGTDTGGKLATLRVMQARGTLIPDIGYWAARWDPRGVLHPLYYTYPVGGHWVNVTTLPMLLAAKPLYALGGPRLVLLLPMLGAVLTAFGARALARRLGGGDGWSAFWAIGLATPVALYALDFWEHAPGLALMLWGVVCVWDLADSGSVGPDARGLRGRSGWAPAIGAGLLFGAAATMRTEALVYLVVSGVVGCTVLARQRHAWFAAAARGVAMAAAAGGVLVANDLVERLVLGTTVRASRAAGTAGGVGTSSSTRIQEAFTTTLGLNAASIGRDIVLGSLVVVLVAFGALRLRRDDGRVIGGAAIACAVLLYLVRFGAGLGFVPGVLTACPLAAVGVVAGWRRPLRLPTLIAVLALPLVWAFQYSGGAGPQWGGRYELLTGALLAVVGVVALRGCRRAFTAVLLVSVLVTGFGVAWLSVRSNTVADGISTVIARSDQMVISRHAHFFREGGALYDPTRHWLTATTDDDLVRAVRIAGETGASEFALVENEGDPVPAHLGAYERGATEVVPFLRPDVRVSVTTYRLRDAPTT